MEKEKKRIKERKERKKKNKREKGEHKDRPCSQKIFSSANEERDIF